MELPAYSSREHSQLSIKLGQFDKLNPVVMSVVNLQGLKAGSGILLDNFLDRTILKCGMDASQDCRSGHRYDTRGFLKSATSTRTVVP